MQVNESFALYNIQTLAAPVNPTAQIEASATQVPSVELQTLATANQQLANPSGLDILA